MMLNVTHCKLPVVKCNDSEKFYSDMLTTLDNQVFIFFICEIECFHSCKLLVGFITKVQGKSLFSLDHEFIYVY